MSQNGEIIPFEFNLSVVDSLVPGDTISIDLFKSAGSEELRGFDFMVAYEAADLTLLDIIPGPIFDIPGEYEWEYIDFPLPPYTNCQIGCPSGMAQIYSIADITGSGHHPLNDPETGRIKVFADSTVLVSLEFEVNPLISPAKDQVPVYFYWNHCSSNGGAFSFRDSSIFDIKQSNSTLVYDYNGTDYIEISDYDPYVPSPFGTPALCLPLCGDVNGDRKADILDVLYLIDYKFNEGPEPFPTVSADVNDDGFIDILDIIYYIDNKFNDGPELVCPVTNIRFSDFYNGGIFNQ